MRSLRILIVDDDEDFADGLTELFELDGHRPTVARNGADAIAILREEAFSVALVDIGLPDMNGADCLRALKQVRPGLPCFLLTGYSADDVARRGIAAGAMEILTKPVDPEDLNRRLANL